MDLLLLICQNIKPCPFTGCVANRNLYQTRSTNDPTCKPVRAFKYPIMPNPGQERCLSTITTWLSKCLSESHKGCQQYRSQPGGDRQRLQPSRLLFLDPDHNTTVQLITVDSSSRYSYVTLSHRWGSPDPPKLTRDPKATFSLASLEVGHPIASLPKVFSEAIRIVQHLKLKYVWIDSLCIFQDSDSDWEAEAGKMGDVYAGGVFNITALDCQNSEGDLFPAQKDTLLPVLPTSGASIHTGSRVGLPKQEFESDIIFSELLSRAWVYQEVLLAPANLFCTTEQMWWSCSGGTCSQTFPESIQQFHTASSVEKSFSSLRREMSATNSMATPVSIAVGWMNILESYTNTSATRPDDRLVAIAGLASAYQSCFPEALKEATYHSVVWSHEIWRQLLWEGRARPDASFPSSRFSTTHPMPTWSCASYNGPIKYQRTEDKSMLPVKLINLESSGLDKFGCATSLEQCTLHLRGALVPMTFIPSATSSSSTYGHTLQTVLFPTGYKDAKVDVAWDNSEELESAAAAAITKKDYVRAVLFQCHPRHGTILGLLLRPSPSSKSTTKFRRWVLCGLVKKFVNPGEFEYYQLAFRVSRYGETFRRETPDRGLKSPSMSFAQSLFRSNATTPMRHKPPEDNAGRKDVWKKRLSIVIMDDIYIV